MTGAVKTIEWTGDRVRIIDQTRLPHEQAYLDINTPEEMVAAIQSMRIRGAPALGVAGAYGVALGARRIQAADRDQFLTQLRLIAETLCAARPTAVNLSWGVHRLLEKVERSEHREPEKLQKMLLAEAQRLLQEDIDANRRLGQFGAGLLPEKVTVLTHCNAGALATAGYGTALGVLRAAKEAGKKVAVFADETRPFLQGARLTAWELAQDDIPVTLIADNAAGFLMSRGEIDCVVVGADRIAANGDVANKIGTYPVAVLAHRHHIPFYVAAPLSTIDAGIASGSDIPIEERSADEVRGYVALRWAPAQVAVRNPVFDVTPAELITGLITEKAVVMAPDAGKISKLLSAA